MESSSFMINDSELIQLVKSHKLIYDKTASGYKIPHMKAEAWRKISEQLNVDDENACQRRWTTLRERFGRELKQYEANVQSGNDIYPTWSNYDAMQFLKEHIRPRTYVKAKEDETFIPDGCQVFTISEPELDIKCVEPVHVGEMVQPSPPKKKRLINSDESSSNTESLQKAMLESAKIFKEVCTARLEEKRKYSDVYSFSNMVAQNLIALSPSQRANAIARITALLMSLRNQTKS